MKLGQFFDSEEVYNSEQHLRCSHVKEIVKSPAHFYNAWKAEQKDSKAFDEGRAVHSVLLEQSLDKYIKRPDGIDGRTKEGKAKLEELSSSGKTVLNADVFDSLYSRLESFTKSTEAMKIYNNAEIEKSFYALDPLSGLHLKARPDIYKPGFIADVKTTSNIAYFEKDIIRYGYHIQAGYYSLVTRLITGVKTKEFIFIAQEKNAPYGIQVFSINEEQLEQLEAKARELVMRVSVCIRENSFPSYDDIKREITLPAFAMNEDTFFEGVG